MKILPARSGIHSEARESTPRSTTTGYAQWLVLTPNDGTSPLYHEGIKSPASTAKLQIETDFLVVGAGVAGLRAAIELAPAGRVLVVAKDSLKESSSQYAQGGIAVALSDDDEVELHEQDTIFAGDGL